VSGKASTVRAEQDLVRLCHRTSDVATLQHDVLRSLRRMLSVDAAFFATADPSTLLSTGAYAEEPLAAATSLFLDNEFTSADVNKFATLATRPHTWPHSMLRPTTIARPACAIATS